MPRWTRMIKTAPMTRRFMAIAACLLAGCTDAPSSLADNLAHPAAPTPPANITAGPVIATTIPASFHGEWQFAEAECGTAAEGRLIVSAAALSFHESIGAVRRVRSIDDEAITVEADFEGEGEAWQADHRLDLSDGGRRLTFAGQGAQSTRVRCLDA